MIVSRETMERLKTYQRLLEMWQQKINLVSASTLPQLWERHFEDSLQLLPHLPVGQCNLVDLGSGAGFPGLILALVRSDDLHVTLVESDLRKSLFLENVSRETKVKVNVLAERIESLVGKIKGDVITARALAPLSELLDYAFPLMNENSIGLFLKGKDAEKEIVEAKKKWEFDLEIFPSLTDSKAHLLKIKYPRRIRIHV